MSIKTKPFISFLNFLTSSAITFFLFVFSYSVAELYSSIDGNYSWMIFGFFAGMISFIIASLIADFLFNMN